VIEGTEITDEWWIGNGRRGRVIRVAIGDWPSGLYYAMLTGSDDKVGYAPFVLRPRHLGEDPVAVVLPTMTWQSYNFHDDDRDGTPDTWYYPHHAPTARLGRPFENRGVPLTGRQLAAAYELIVSPGHHEYVTTHEYDAVVAFRDLGGNLMFLSANNFFWRIVQRGEMLRRTATWRSLGRPEAALIGVQYRANDRGAHRGAFVVRDAADDAWFFEGTNLVPGAEFGDYGIEIDSKASSSPRETHVLAEIPNLLGPGVSAQMTYYETPAGAKVFAAGAFTLAGRAFGQPENRLLGNLWARLTQP
jgi:hypothetical protein